MSWNWIVQTFWYYLGWEQNEKTGLRKLSVTQQQIKIQKTRNNLEQLLKQLDNEQKKLQACKENLTLKAKDFVKNNKKKEAKKIFDKIIAIDKNLKKNTAKGKLIQMKLNELNQFSDNKKMMDNIAETKNIIPNGEEINQKIIDEIQQVQLNRQMNDKNWDMIIEMQKNNQDEQSKDEMLADLEAQIQRQEKIQQKNIAQKQVYLKVFEQKDISKDDQIEKMMKAIE